MIQAEHERRAADDGATREELHERARALINPEPLPEEELAAMRASVKKRAAEWTPVCEHDTNPWTGDG